MNTKEFVIILVSITLIGLLWILDLVLNSLGNVGWIVLFTFLLMCIPSSFIGGTRYAETKNDKEYFQIE